MFTIVAFVGGLVAALGCSGGDDDTTVAKSRCEKLRDHVIELRLATAKGVDVDAHRAIMERALGTDFLTSCEKMPEAQVDCALAATDSQGAAACSGAAQKEQP